jgi:hypothetical protein
MKKLVFLIIVGAGIWLGVNYVKTGQLTLFPPKLSAEEQELKDLEAQLEAVKAKMAAEGRAAGMTGMDTTSAVSGLLEEQKRLEARIAALKSKLGR